MAAEGLGQQCKAAPAWMARTEPVAKGRRAMSARTATTGVGGTGLLFLFLFLFFVWFRQRFFRFRF
jgi:hypothetical protein